MLNVDALLNCCVTLQSLNLHFIYNFTIFPINVGHLLSIALHINNSFLAIFHLNGRVASTPKGLYFRSNYPKVFMISHNCSLLSMIESIYTALELYHDVQLKKLHYCQPWFTNGGHITFGVKEIVTSAELSNMINWITILSRNLMRQLQGLLKKLWHKTSTYKCHIN